MTIGIGIETSCDETSIAIVRDGSDLLSLKIYSQIKLHSIYQGIVPEIASRSHLEKINFLFQNCLEESGVTIEEFDYIAVTAFPGLIGSLIVGAQLARCLSLVLQKPIITVDHLEAHLNVVELEGKKLKFPYLGVLLSGGNTAIFQVDGYGNMKTIGDTIDDALGEAFDKVAALLDLPYPGGPSIEALSKKYEPNEQETPIFPTLLKGLPQNKIRFSYSGLKTSVMYFINKLKDNERNNEKICFHFQNSAFDLVEKNIQKAIHLTGIKEVVCAGGVLANETLRKRLKEFSTKSKINLYFPNSKILCTDNGAMIASLGYHLYKMGKSNKLDFIVSPRRKEFKSI